MENIGVCGSHRVTAKVPDRITCMLTSAILDEHEEVSGVTRASGLRSAKLLKQMRCLRRSKHESSGALLEEQGLQAACPISFIDIGLKATHPVLHVEDLFHMLAKEGQLNALSGGLDPLQAFATFWDRYEDTSHPVYSKHAGHLDRVVPMAIYADEGQSHKKASFLALALQPVIGRGTTAASQSRSRDLGTNMAGCSVLTRLLYSVTQAQLYRKSPKIFENLLDAFAHELATAFEQGLQVELLGEQVTLFPAVIFCKGDWPMLRKIGNLKRTFAQANAAPSKSSGVCHLCMAGVEKFPDWHKSENALWMCPESLLEPELPWPVETSVTALLATSTSNWGRAWFYRPDVFHTLHKGLLAELTGSAFDTWSSKESFLGVCLVA